MQNDLYLLNPFFFPQLYIFCFTDTPCIYNTYIYFCFSVTELLPCNQDEHIEEQEMSNRCQNNDEREANLVSLLQNAITDSVIIDVTVDRIQSDKTFDSVLHSLSLNSNSKLSILLMS